MNDILCQTNFDNMVSWDPMCINFVMDHHMIYSFIPLFKIMRSFDDLGKSCASHVSEY